MRIGIIEVCEPNHYTAVMALAKTYAANKNNQVVIYSLEQMAPLFSGCSKNVSIKTKQHDDNITDFLNHIASAGLDRIHINTLSNYYKEFSATKWNSNIWFTVHNTDIFFANDQSHRLRLLLFEWSLSFKSRSAAYFKNAFIQYIKDFGRQHFRNRFIKKLLLTNYKIIVYSHSQKKHLEKYIKASKIVIFPFCLYENIDDTSASNTRLRISIPGSVTNRRRDYNSLIRIINIHLDFFREHVTIDILGYIPKNERHLADEFTQLSKKGVDIIFNLDFVDKDDYDQRLGKADILLGNLKVQMDPYRKYGETKETGVTFNVIKAGKPVLLPEEYSVDSSLRDICVFFCGYNDLYNKVKEMVSNSSNINLLKEKAYITVQAYTPQKLYHLLIN